MKTNFTASYDVNFDPNCSLLLIIFICDLTHYCYFCACLVGFTVVCSAVGTQGSDTTFSSELARVTGGPASGEGLQRSQSDDDDLEIDEELSGGDNENFSLGTANKTNPFLIDLDFLFHFKCWLIWFEAHMSLLIELLNL